MFCCVTLCHVNSTPQLYCLLHPADTLAAATLNCLEGSGRLTLLLFFTYFLENIVDYDDCLELVFTCRDLPVAVFVSAQTGAHSIWSLKQIEPSQAFQLLTSDCTALRPSTNLRSLTSSRTPMLMTGSGLGFISRQSSKGSLHLNHPFSRSSSPFAPTTASGRTPDSARPMFGTQLWSDASGHSSKPESLTTVIHQCHSKGRSQGSHQSSTVSLAQRLIRIDYRTLPRCAPPSFSPYHMRRRVANVSGVDHDISFGDKSLLDAMAPLCSALELNRVWIDEVTGG